MNHPARFVIAVLAATVIPAAVAAAVWSEPAWLFVAAAAGAAAAATALAARRRPTSQAPPAASPAPEVIPHPPAVTSAPPSATVTVLVPQSATPVVQSPFPEVDAPAGRPATAVEAEPELTTSPVERPSIPDLALSMPSGVEPSDVVEALLTNAAAAGSPVAASLWLEDPASATMRLVAATGSARPEGTPEPIEGSILGRALESRTALLHPLWRVRTAETERLTYRFAIPLVVGEARGAAAVDLLGAEPPNGAVLTAMSASLRGPLTGALALHIARTETATARALLNTARDMSRLLEPDAVLRMALANAMELGEAETGSIMLLDEGTRRMRIAVSIGLSADVVETTEVSEGEGIAGWVLASGKPLAVEDLNGRGPRSRRHGVRSAISVPLADEDGTIGVLNVGSRVFHARFSSSHLEALESLARAATVAWRNAHVVTSARDLYFDTLKAFAIALEIKDPYALGGTDRVIEHAVALGTAMGLSKSEAIALRIAAMLHDIGMSAAGDVITVSNRPLSTVEWGMLKMHPVIAGEILAQAPALRDAIPIVYHHHEHYDGTGYVVGLSGSQIPLGARILAIADAYVAMTSDRPYRKAMSHAEAVAELTERSGTQFDPDVVRAFIEITQDRSEDTASNG